MQHLQLYLQNGLEWPPDWSSVPELDAASAPLPDRAREVIFYQEHVMKLQHAEAAESVHDVNMSLGWASTALDCMPCIVCSSTMWLSKERRQVFGGELLAAQGFPAPKLISVFFHEELTTLAGNAFNGFVALAAGTATFCFLTFCFVLFCFCASAKQTGHHGFFGAETEAIVTGQRV